MDKVHKITTLDEVWKPGDVVLDAEGNLRIRATTDAAYPWGDTRTRAACGTGSGA
ncbi:hypothetical protein [Streptomyces sp. NPDC087294]|uniref:hypothetical protein n=1 Tax=Streptomyces sp. NPDC087294 TaxID=3365777 RepID=UPI003829B1DD